MSGALTAVSIISAAALLAMGGVGATAVAGMSRDPDDSSHIYGGLAISITAVSVMALVSFVVTYFVR
jgi:F0F1-type ATP synthase membrane subunit c/vacuolar-type H+-ATPase subunit K